MALDLVDTFLTTARIAVGFVASPAVRATWHEPSALPEYNVGALAAHLGRALVSVDAYRSAPPPPDGAEPIDAATYFVMALGDHDPVTSRIHQGVRRRAADAAAGGPEHLAEDLSAVYERLEVGLDPTQRVGVFGDLVMELGEYLETRIVELVVHMSDLARSVGAVEPALPEHAWRIAAGVLTSVVLQRSDSRAVTLGLARADSFDTPGAFAA